MGVSVLGFTLARGQETAATEAAIFISEYRVAGVHKLPQLAVEEAVYPYLGPGRTRDDIEAARAALEAAYHARGFQTVGVQIPAQPLADGIIRLQVFERKVGRLRVKGAKYSSPRKIKEQAPSLAEGAVIDFNRVPKDIVALNQSADRQVMPSLRAGAGETVDVDLEVKETPPLHASVELNNRHGAGTTPLRVSATVSAANLAQSGNGAGFSFQGSPQKSKEVKVFSAYYVQHFSGAEWLSLMASATKQDSEVSTLTDSGVVGRGQSAFLRGMFTLPGGVGFFQSASLTFNYRKFKEKVLIAASGTTPAILLETPVTSWPVEAGYAATWQGKKAITEFNASTAFGLRGVGSNSAEYNLSRYKADGNFLVLRADLARTQELPWGFQIKGKVQGQLANQPLLTGDLAIGGGLGTVRGYLEAEAVADSGAFGSVELHTPSLLGSVKAFKSEWRFFTFADTGWLKAVEPLPEQKDHYFLLSYGIGSRLRLFDHFDSLVIASLPQNKVGPTKAQDWRITFKAVLDY